MYSSIHAKLLVVVSLMYGVVIHAVQLVMWINHYAIVLTSEIVRSFIKCNFCQAQSQLQVKLSLKTELALFPLNPAKPPNQPSSKLA